MNYKAVCAIAQGLADTEALASTPMPAHPTESTPARLRGRWLRRLAATAVGAGAAGAAGVVWSASRSRRPLPGMERFDPPPLPPARILAVPGHGELFVREASGPGEGAPTVLLLHGWMFPADLNWFTAYGPLAEAARVLAVDHRGHGRGSRPSMPFRLADAADDAAALLAHLGTGPVVVVGCSLGGPVAQLLWQRHPEAVRGLVLCATAARFQTTPLSRYGWRAMGALQVLLRLLPRATFERLLLAQGRGTLPFRITQTITEESAELAHLLPWVVGELERGDPEDPQRGSEGEAGGQAAPDAGGSSLGQDLAEAGRQLSRYDARGWLPTVDVPSALVVTTRDRLVPPSDQRALAALIPGAEVFEVDLDHDAPGAGPQEFSAALVKAVLHVAGG